MTDTWILRNVRPLGEAASDLLIEGDSIAAVVAAGTATAPDAAVVDGRGLLAIPGLINAHAHVDKSWWDQPWVPYGGVATTQGRIEHERAHRDELQIPSVGGVEKVLREFLRHGTTATRTHVDVDLGLGLRGVEDVLEAGRNLGGAVGIEIVAFPQDGVIRRPGVIALLEEAASMGVANIGGLDPAGIDRDPVAQLDALFDIVDRTGTGLDIHLHDEGELGRFQLELIIERTLAVGAQGRVNIAHGFALGEISERARQELLPQLAEAGISWTTVAPVGSAPLPWRAMRDAGMGLGLGTDGIRDLWNPFGDGDLLRVALTFARLHGMRTDDALARAVSLASTEAAPFVHREQHDLAVGSRADVVLVDAQNVPDALVRAPRRELVVAGGRVVVENGVVTV
ncbi:cytosine deaminase [Microbacterium mangrovi]|uniref:Cytosine deaminase n=1 Tax=Microbacterium mangrovi TaxID=1348253 RepID=A0A0B2A7R9_9MICO|nr:amidohydrolase [Microbacterium mangrovi]KHK99150.1 cytosine deaminase [Microbacterium mangrovi]